MASRPFAPAALGDDHEPEASITASARMLFGPAPFWYLSSNGAWSRPFVLTLSYPTRLIAVTRLAV